LREYVRGGGGLMMIGGYYSFQGINGGARYHGTAVEETLPVDCLPYDDRIEVPEGSRAEIVGPKEIDPRRAGRRMAAPSRRERGQAQGPLGCAAARPPAGIGGRPSAARDRQLRQRPHLAWTSDIGPHWLPQTFAQWERYPRRWQQALAWLTRQA
jgi:uncharacterized membrane protein